jgi:hypothetical protein
MSMNQLHHQLFAELYNQEGLETETPVEMYVLDGIFTMNQTRLGQ